MKTSRVLLMAVCLLPAVLVACKKEPLPAVDYPVQDIAQVEEALAAWGLDCTVEEMEPFTVSERNISRTSYSFTDNETGYLIGSVATVQNGEERGLLLGFLRNGAPHAIPLTESEGAFVFAARLYGGFADERQMVGSFVQEYGISNTVQVEAEIGVHNHAGLVPGVISWWECRIGDVFCSVRVEQPVPDGVPGEACITQIHLVSDWDTFYPNSEQQKPGTQS